MNESPLDRDGRPDGTRGASETVGVVLLLGIVLVGAGLTFGVWSTAQGQFSGDMTDGKAERSMQHLQSTVETLADDPTRRHATFDFGANGRVRTVDGDELTLTLNETSVCSSTTMLPRLRHPVGEEESLVYQAGAVWRVTDAGRTMLSPPSVDYRTVGSGNATLGFDVVHFEQTRAEGEFGLNKNVTESYDRTRDFESRLFGPPECDRPSSVNLTVKSERFADQWETQLERSMPPKTEFERDGERVSATLNESVLPETVNDSLNDVVNFSRDLGEVQDDGLTVDKADDDNVYDVDLQLLAAQVGETGYQKGSPETRDYTYEGETEETEREEGELNTTDSTTDSPERWFDGTLSPTAGETTTESTEYDGVLNTTAIEETVVSNYDGLDVAIALDASCSMNGNNGCDGSIHSDSSAAKAPDAIEELMGDLAAMDVSNQASLTTFPENDHGSDSTTTEGSAYLQEPMTSNLDAINTSAQSALEGPTGTNKLGLGTPYEDGLQTANDTLTPDPDRKRIMIVVADGKDWPWIPSEICCDTPRSEDDADAIAASGTTIHTVGIDWSGRPLGAITSPDGQEETISDASELDGFFEGVIDQYTETNETNVSANWTRTIPVDPAANEVTLDLQGDPGTEFDLYVDNDSTPPGSPGAAEYAGETPGSDESLTVSPSADELGVLVHAPADSGTGEFTLNVTERFSSSGSSGNATTTFDPDPAATDATFDLSGDAGTEFDLYVDNDSSPPTNPADAEYASATPGSDESISLSPPADELGVLVNAPAGSTPGAFELSLTTTVPGTENGSDSATHDYEFPAGATDKSVELSGPPGTEFDLYVDNSSSPPASPATADFSSAGPDADESVSLPDSATDVGVLVRAPADSPSGEYDLTFEWNVTTETVITKTIPTLDSRMINETPVEVQLDNGTHTKNISEFGDGPEMTLQDGNALVLEEVGATGCDDYEDGGTEVAPGYGPLENESWTVPTLPPGATALDPSDPAKWNGTTMNHSSWGTRVHSDRECVDPSATWLASSTDVTTLVDGEKLSSVSGSEDPVWWQDGLAEAVPDEYLDTSGSDTRVDLQDNQVLAVFDMDESGGDVGEETDLNGAVVLVEVGREEFRANWLVDPEITDLEVRNR
jgi:Mg-chelatase subunit ChlD